MCVFRASFRPLHHAERERTDGMFTILIPVSLAPLMVTLFWAERKAKRLGLVEKALGRPGASEAVAAKPVVSRSFIGAVWHWTQTFDLIGLVFLETAVALILVPLTLSSTEAKGWHDGAFLDVASGSAC